MSRDYRPIYWPTQTSNTLPEEDTEKFERNARKYWDRFYKEHQDGFFRDRHYLHREFPALEEGAPTILEVGCGVGNTAFPLLEVNPQARVYACDFSATAIQCVQRHALYASGRITAFVADITSDRLSELIPPATVDICTMVFVLSAISPPRMTQAISNVAEVLKPGGAVFVRDYALGDMAEGRFAGSRRQKCIGPQFYVRGDGTRAFYFSEEGLSALFNASAFTCEYVLTHERVVENQALGTKMDRRWIQAVFRLTGAAADNLSPGHVTCVMGADEAAATPLRHLWEAAAKGEITGQAQAAGEWEASEQLHEVTDGIGQLFAGLEDSADLVTESFTVPKAGTFLVRSVSREHKHTSAHTGLMMWDASPVLAAYLASSPHLLDGRRVLELGCGANPLCMLAALRHARRVVSTDGSAQALQAMADNLALNASKVVIERARLRHLAWGDEQHIQGLLTEHPAGFDVVIGADVVYAEEFVPLLFQTASRLASAEAKLLLCHVTRRVSEDRIIAAAPEVGFQHVSMPDGAGGESVENGAVRLLHFARQRL